MNIFALDDSPELSAQMMCDKHISKMIVESAQMLSTAHRMLDGQETRKQSRSGKRWVRYFNLPVADEDLIYKAVHFNHPCTVWCRQNDSNYTWLYDHMMYLGIEYTKRYGKTHSTIELLGERLCEPPKNIKYGLRTPFALAMPDEYKSKDAQHSYRIFYKNEKTFAKWERGVSEPHWWKNISKKVELALNKLGRKRKRKIKL